MNLRSTVVSVLLALSLAASFSAQADGPMAGPGHCPMQPPDGEHRHGDGMGPGGFSGADFGPAMPFPREIQLSEAQKDKLFDLFLNQARAMRDKGKALQKADAELRAVTAGDDSRLRSLVDARAKAWAEVTLLRLRGERQALEVLTPEQRRQVEELRQKREKEFREFGESGRGGAPASLRDGRPEHRPAPRRS